MRLLSLPLRRAAVVSACRVTAGNAGAARGAASASAARAMTSLATARASKQHHHHHQRRRMATTAAVPDSMVLNGKPALTTTAFRTHTCGELRSAEAGSEVMLCGWISQIRKFGEGLTFVTLRDTYGSVQLTLGDGGGGDAAGRLESLRNASTESVVKIVGTVKERSAENVNADMDTGEIEVVVADVEILNPASTLPFPLSSTSGEPNHNLRHKFRYLDLRREKLQHAIRLRSKLALATRSFLAAERGFVEIETPTLFKRTPGGSTEFPVPTQTPGQFYTLVQSPQQFKQLLMVGGYDRYFQLARCYRDEGGRGDRQPEFTQIDIEMSFAAQGDIEDTVASLVQTLWKEGLDVDLPLPFPRMAYADAMRDYGVDKPDTRFGMKLHNVSGCFNADTTSSEIISTALKGDDGAMLGLKLDNAAGIFDKKTVNKLQDHVRGIGAPGVITVHVQDDGTWAGFIAKHVSDEEVAAVNAKFDAKPGDVLVLAAGGHDHMQGMLGILRLYCADVLEDNGVTGLRDPSEFNFLWVDSFPLFEPPEDDSIDSSGALESTHHVFTAPKPGDEKYLYTDPTKVRGQHFDLVLNGVELGGGSVRNHQPEVQRYIIEDVLGKDVGHFSHLIEALGYGAPPHGGLAIGFDRLMMVMSGSDSLREVIAFPKSFAGKDLMGGAPAALTPEYLEVYHIKPVVPKDE